MKTCKVSAIIVSQTGTDVEKAKISLLNALNVSPINLEIFVAVGNNPSLQRNEAAKLATGEFLLFLDHDQLVDQNIFRHFIYVIGQNESVDIVGGPSLFPHAHSLFEKMVKVIFSSSFGIGPFRSRYFSIGKVRKTGEYELILSNLFVRRQLFSEGNGFNTNLYPSEENEFLNRMKKVANIYYHPLMYGYRPPRKNVKELFIQMFRYGHGRMKHLLTNFELSNVILLIPLFFVLYIICLPFYISSSLFHFPLYLYLIFSLSSSLMGAFSLRKPIAFIFLPFLMFGVHLFYGLGTLFGLRNLFPYFYKKRESTVNVTSLKTFL